MTEPEHPNLRQALLPPRPIKPKVASAPKKRKGKKEEEEPTLFELAEDDLTNVGPILFRSKQQHDNYVLVLKNDQSIDFHRANWTSSGDDSFITLYRKTANTWEIIDVCVDDISTVSISVSAEDGPPDVVPASELSEPQESHSECL